jgi:hypothetical protein
VLILLYAESRGVRAFEKILIKVQHHVHRETHIDIDVAFHISSQRRDIRDYPTIFFFPSAISDFAILVNCGEFRNRVWKSKYTLASPVASIIGLVQMGFSVHVESKN